MSHLPCVLLNVVVLRVVYADCFGIFPVNLLFFKLTSVDFTDAVVVSGSFVVVPARLFDLRLEELVTMAKNFFFVTDAAAK